MSSKNSGFPTAVDIGVELDDEAFGHVDVSAISPQGSGEYLTLSCNVQCIGGRPHLEVVYPTPSNKSATEDRAQKHFPGLPLADATELYSLRREALISMIMARRAGAAKKVNS